MSFNLSLYYTFKQIKHSLVTRCPNSNYLFDNVHALLSSLLCPHSASIANWQKLIPNHFDFPPFWLLKLEPGNVLSQPIFYFFLDAVYVAPVKLEARHELRIVGRARSKQFDRVLRSRLRAEERHYVAHLDRAKE